LKRSSAIARQLLQWAKVYNLELERRIELIVRNRDGRALTRALFEIELGQESIRLGAIDRIHGQISLAFTQVYISELDGDIMSGIPSLGLFDVLSKQAPLLDFVLLYEIVQLVLGRGAVRSVAIGTSEFDAACAMRGTASQVIFSNLVMEFLSRAANAEQQQQQAITSKVRHGLRGKIIRSLASNDRHAASGFDGESLSRGCDVLKDAITNLQAP
jgi:hypothetical protein